ncbi:hypothetical protein GCM10022231_14320 [Gordonia caeni]|uniref:Uncharacterized protein n=1 Tax=Gordonia caeni TaxID=1007097 RepID=A0ABP7NZ95_9ACTN
MPKSFSRLRSGDEHGDPRIAREIADGDELPIAAQVGEPETIAAEVVDEAARTAAVLDVRPSARCHGGEMELKSSGQHADLPLGDVLDLHRRRCVGAGLAAIEDHLLIASTHAPILAHRVDGDERLSGVRRSARAAQLR